MNAHHYKYYKLNDLQNKLLNRLANGAEQTEGERIIKEHQINKDVLEETIQKYYTFSLLLQYYAHILIQ